MEDFVIVAENRDAQKYPPAWFMKMKVLLFTGNVARSVCAKNRGMFLKTE